jgi:hypothetical protein
MVTNDARCTHEVALKIAKNSTQQRESYFHQQIGLKCKEKLVKCYIWSRAVYGAETWTLRKTDQKYLESLKGNAE